MATKGIPRVTQWAVGISDPALTYASNNTSAQRPGSNSCYPAAFAQLVAAKCVFAVKLDSTHSLNNWLTFGLTKTGFATTNSDGFGREPSSWGFADERGNSGTMAFVADCKSRGADLPRKFREGDILTAEVDTDAGWCELRLNQTEFTHRFTIPTGSKSDYWFGMTFANDHRATIFDDSGSSPAAPVAATGSATVARVWATDISNTELAYSNNNTSVKRPGSISCYPAAFARLSSEHSTFTVRLDAAQLDSNWISFGIAKQGFAKTNSDGFGRESNSWGIADERSSGNTTIPSAFSGSKTGVATMPRKLREGDILTAEANTTAGWCEVRLNQTEFKHRFTIPAGSKDDYWFGMTFANDHQVTIQESPNAKATPAAAASGVAASSGVAIAGPKAWETGISNTSLEYTNGNATVKRPGSASCYPACFALLTATHCALTVKIDAAKLDSNWISFGVCKTGFAKDSSDGMGRTTDSWGIADERSSGNTTMPVVASSKATVGNLARKLREGDFLTAEIDTTAGWCELCLNQTEFKHRFIIPAGRKEDYWFGMTFANDHRVTIQGGGAAATPATVGASPTEWSVDISNSSLTFSNDNKTTMRVGSVSSYPAAFARLTGERCSFHVTVDQATISSNWLTFGITEAGMANSASDGMGRTTGSWGIQDDRSDASVMPTAIADRTMAATLPRKFQVGDHLSAEVDTSAGWCEVQLNQTEFKHRFTIPVGKKEDYWFGMTFANDHQVTLSPAGGPLPAAASSVLAAAQPSGRGPIEWSTDISNTELAFSNANTTTMRPGGASSYPAAFARLTAELCTFNVRIDAAKLDCNWLTFGIAKQGMAKSSSDGFGRTANTWGIVDDRNSASTASMAFLAADKTTLGSLPRKLREGDLLTAEANTSAGWCEVRLNQTEFKHRFTIPAGRKEDYWFGMTFANDHQVTILPGDGSSVASQEENLLAAALQQGSKKWKRSKFSLLGQGRAGKTAFANAIAGRQFEETASTVGINQLTCDVKHIQATGGEEREQEWGECTKHMREFEAALAEILARRQRQAQGKAEAETAPEKGGDIRAYMESVTEAAGPSAEQAALAAAAEADASAEFTSSPSASALPAPSTAPEPVQKQSQVQPQAASPAKPEPVSAQTSAAQAAAPVVEEEPAGPPKPELDEEMVMKMLATMQDAESGLLISLFDFGGQSVFEVIHHLFLTRNGVYALVFNMEWLLTDGPDKERGLRFMRGWLSSIAIHTFNKTTQMTAPIVIVGTRLDTVTSPAAHEKISTILHEHFSDNLAWRSVIGNENGRDSNGRAFQWFFPVDNKLGKKGPAMKHLMSVVHGVIDKAEYTHKEVPLTWFKTIDQMADTKKDCLTLQEVISTAGRCDVTEREVPFLLSFLHDMGHLMWLDEPGLRDVVILDPVSYLVVPATIIICKLTPDHKDTTHHFMTSHRECERMHKREWTLLKHDGVLSVKLLPILWEKYQKQSEALQMLMVKFGLLVPLRSEAAGGTISQYLVPTLLAPASPNDPNVTNWTDGVFSSCYFVFSLAEEMGLSSTVTEADLKSLGFLPGGMFERIVGKALSWSQDTARGCSINLQSVMLHKDMAVLAFGRQRFRLVHCADIHCVRVDVEGNNPVGVQQKLQDFIKLIVAECMKSLLCFPAVAFQSAGGEDHAAHVGLFKHLLPNELLIPLQQLRKAGKGESMLAWRGGRTLITLPEIKSRYGQWLQLYDLRERYDVFISYRWGRYDSEFTEQLFDMFSNFSVGLHSRAVEVFLDRKRLQEGRLFKTDFAAALTHTLIAVPIVSVDALGRMVEHDPAQQDNVLLEWTMILESFKAGKILKVFPVLFGTRKPENVRRGKVTSGGVIVVDFFTEAIKDYLPKVVPTATLAQAEELLRSNGIEPSQKMRSYTVHSIVHELLQFLLFKASDCPDGRLVGIFADKVVHLLSDCGNAALDAVHDCATGSAAPVTPSTKAAAVTPFQRTQGTVSPAPAGGNRALKSLTVDEVGRMLAELGMDKLIPIFAANKVSGKRLYHCEEFGDLMSEDIGVVSKPTAKELMEQIEEWRETGVSGL